MRASLKAPRQTAGAPASVGARGDGVIGRRNRSYSVRVVTSERSGYGLGLLAAAFAVIAVAGATAVLVPIALYAPVFGPRINANIPELPIVPLLAGVVLGLSAMAFGTAVPLATAAWRGLTIGFGAALYVGLVRAVVLLLHDPYFTTPYRAYGLLMVGLLTAGASGWLWRVARGRTSVAEPRLLAWPLLAVIGATAVLTLVTGGFVAGASALIAALTGVAIAERGPSFRVKLSERTVVGVLVALTFVFRAFFGLQTLARTGPGMAFAVASDDGPSYFDYASALYADPSAITRVLTANDGFPPAYSLFIAGIFAVTRGSLAAVIVVQAVAAMAATILIYLIARRLGGRAVAFVAAAIFATEANLIQNASTLTPESILVPTLLFVLWALERYRASSEWRWLAAAALATGLAFVTRNNVGGVLLAAGSLWLVVTWRGRRLRALGAAAVLALGLLALSLPVAVATAQLEGAPRLTNQLAGVVYEEAGNDPITIENAFLITRGINPFRDPLGSLGRIASDPLPVLGFFWSAVPQRMSTLLFLAPSGAADPVAVISPTRYPNMYGQLIQLALVLALMVATAIVAKRRPWLRQPLAGLLLTYTGAYLALFAFVFAPSHAFRYRIPVEPIMFMAEGAGLVVLGGLAHRLWLRSPRATPEEATR